MTNSRQKLRKRHVLKHKVKFQKVNKKEKKKLK